MLLKYLKLFAETTWQIVLKKPHNQKRKKRTVHGEGRGKQKAENEQATIIFCELITHLQIWQNNSEEAGVSFCSIFSQYWKQKCQKSLCKACSDEISSQFHESSWFGLTVNKPLGRTSKSWVHWSQTLLCMGSDPTLNKGNEKPTGAAYLIAVEPLCGSLQSSWSRQLFPDTGNWMGVNFAYGPFT